MQQIVQRRPSAPLPIANHFHESFNLEAELFSQQRQDLMQPQQQCFPMPNMVPPTPNSVEMHGGRAQHSQPRMDKSQQDLYEHYRRFQKDQVGSNYCRLEIPLTCFQMNFTPLVSPAVTPLDTQLRYPDYATSSVSFSPLNSPALQAQNHTSVYSNVRSSDTSDTMSPADTNVDYSAPTLSSNATTLRKSRRKASVSTTKNPARSVKQSPAMKPQSRKKQASSAAIPPKEVASIIEEARKSRDSSKKPVGFNGKSQIVSSQESSGVDSVSPEPSSDILMPPPATPRSNSAGKSPHLSAGRNEAYTGGDQLEEPATPASLMRIRKQTEKASPNHDKASRIQDQLNLAEVDMDCTIEDILPLGSATSRSKKSSSRSIDTLHTNTQKSSHFDTSPKITHKTPHSRPTSMANSNISSPPAVPSTSPNDTARGKRRDLKHKSSEPKKHGSTTNEKASPAVRPKISPSIKPLLPEGGKCHYPYLDHLKTFSYLFCTPFRETDPCESSHRIARNLCPPSRIQIQLPKYIGGYPSAWRLLSGNSLL